jgi:hypothetical protein
MQVYSRDRLKGPGGEILATGQNSALVDMNCFVWVNREQIEVLCGARFSASATLPIANNSLTSDVQVALRGLRSPFSCSGNPATFPRKPEPCRVSSTYDGLLRSSSFEYLVPLAVISSAKPLSVI